MICRSIEELTILYLENELDDENQEMLLEHIKACDRCKLLFEGIKDNYKAEMVVEGKPDISSNIMSLVNRNRYVLAGKRNRIRFKRVLILAVIFTLLIISAANADGIYKSYKELKERMFVDKRLLNISGIIHTGRYSDKDFINEIYMKYESEIEDFAGKMKTGENRVLIYDEEGREFKVQIARSSKGYFISYGFDGYTIFSNDYLDQFHKNQAAALVSGFIKYASAGELLESVNFLPLSEYVPDGYELEYSYKISRSDSCGLHYSNHDGGFLRVELSKNKLALNNVGIPGELIAAAGLKDSDIPEQEEDSFSEEILIGDLQGVYVQERIYNAAVKDESKIFKTINLYLGDGAFFPFLRISSSSLEKNELIKIAENTRVLSHGENMIDEKEYFIGITDENILTHTKEFLDKIKSGRTQFEITVDENTRFYRHSHNDTYYIMYRKVDADKYKSMIPFDFVPDPDTLEKFEYVDVQIMGRPYEPGKSYYISFVNNKRTGLGISIDKILNMPGDHELNDLIIYGMSGMRDSIDPFFDDLGHLYYIVGTEDRSWVVRTAVKDGAGYRNVNIIADKDIFETYEDLKQFLISLDMSGK